MISIEFLLTSLVIILIPGTGVIYTVSNGLFLGKKESVAAAMGCTAGIIPHLLASILGLSAILHMSAFTFQLIKYAGAAYLIYLAWLTWNETGALQFNPTEKKKNLRQIIFRGFLINILNPKLSLFFLAFLPLFISKGSESPTMEMFFLSTVFMFMTLIIFILYGISSNIVSQYALKSEKTIRYIQRTFAGIFALLGVKLATD